MKKRNKFLIGLGIAGILGLGYYFLPRDNSTNKAENQSAEVSEAGAAKGSKKARKIIPKININSGFQEEKDEFRDYINNLDIGLPFLLDQDYKECDLGKLTQKYNTEHKSFANLETSNEHILWKVIDNIIKINVDLANCLYHSDKNKADRLLKEVAEHYEKRGSYGSAGRMYSFLGDHEKALKNFKKDPLALEALIKLTPAEELPALGDKFIADKRYLEAGKIEWYQSNKERARQIIEQSEEFNEALKAAKESLKKREYEEAIDHLWMDSRIPFFRDIIKNLCGENKDCLDKLKEYNTSENVPVMLF